MSMLQLYYYNNIIANNFVTCPERCSLKNVSCEIHNYVRMLIILAKTSLVCTKIDNSLKYAFLSALLQACKVMSEQLVPIEST